MKNPNLSIRFLFTFSLLLICSFAAQAQTRTFVSGLGSDANPCTRVSPCRTFQRAHDVVDAGGEVIAVDSEGYGPLTINKSVSIIGDGVYAAINPTSGDGVTIATPGVVVSLRSLIIQGSGSSNRGIQATHFTALHIENCTINRFVNDGIRVQATVFGVISKVFIKNTISRNNGTGIFMISGGGEGLRASVTRSRAENNGTYGMIVTGVNAVGVVRDCVSSGNTAGGLLSEAAAVLNIENTVASNNDRIGIENNGGARVRVSNSTIMNNATFGFFNSTGTFESRGNNTVAGNNGGGPQASGSITPLGGI